MREKDINEMRGVRGKDGSSTRWVRLYQEDGSIEVRVDTSVSVLTPAQAKRLGDQLYELAQRIEQPE